MVPFVVGAPVVPETFVGVSDGEGLVAASGADVGATGADVGATGAEVAATGAEVGATFMEGPAAVSATAGAGPALS